MTTQNINYAISLKNENDKHTLSWLDKVKTFLVNILMTQDCELKITQEFDRTGNCCWLVYDPLTEKTVYLKSQEEVHWWLEQQYLQPAEKSSVTTG